MGITPALIVPYEEEREGGKGALVSHIHLMTMHCVADSFNEEVNWEDLIKTYRFLVRKEEEGELKCVGFDIMQNPDGVIYTVRSESINT